MLLGCGSFLGANLAVKALLLTQSLIFILLCCPRCPGTMSALGRHSLYAYLLHIPALQWRAKLLYVPGSPDPARQTFYWIAALIFSVLLAVLLCSAPIRCLFRLFLEPTWLLKLSSARNNRSSKPENAGIPQNKWSEVAERIGNEVNSSDWVEAIESPSASNSPSNRQRKKRR